MIVNYAVFENNELFVGWQKENDVKVFTVQPFISSAAVDLTQDHGCQGGFKSQLAVFVTYGSEG